MRWVQIVLQMTGSEIWSCTRALNNRGTMTVLLVGRTRYRTDRRTKASVRELAQEGWELIHRFQEA